MAPAVFIVPGCWEGPTVFDPLVEALSKSGLKATVASIAMTGTRLADGRTVLDSVAGVREQLLVVIEEAGNDGVIAVCHSAGGFLGPAAMEGLSTQARREQGKTGGVMQIVFVAGITYEPTRPDEVIPQISNLKLMESYGLASEIEGYWHCNTPEKLMFNDLSPDEAAKWTAALKPEPGEGWSYPLTYMGWQDIPTIYVLCELDQVLAPPIQEMCAARANSPIERVSAGHMVQLSQPGRLVEIISRFANGVEAQ
ncbi:Alpha/Beta hydrolase protein [Xylariales sp. PMI_506]|nr:Alpha/Beta hydrolase protein [Xylariales sp. PMI_506]